MGKTNKNSRIPRVSEDELNKKLNLGIAMYGETPEWQTASPASGGEALSDSGEYYSSTTFGDGWEEMVPNSSNSARPRALAAGYHHKAEILVIAFRKPTKRDKATKTDRVVGDSPWIAYLEVPEYMWEDLKTAGSTGRWLLDSGIEMHEYFPVDRNKLVELVSDTLNV